MRGTFVLYDTRELPGAGVHETERVPTTPAAARVEDLLFTSLNLTKTSAEEGFSYAQVLHRQVLRPEQLGECRFRYAGRELRELLVERRLTAYYSRKRGLLVCHAERDLVRSAIRALNLGIDGFHGVRVQLDPQCVRRAHAGGAVIGVWLRRPGDPRIRTQAAFGDDVEGGASVSQGMKNGEVSSISLQTKFDRQSLRVNISRGGSVFFVSDTPLATCLAFLVDLLKCRAKLEPAMPKRPTRRAGRRAP